MRRIAMASQYDLPSVSHAASFSWFVSVLAATRLEIEDQQLTCRLQILLAVQRVPAPYWRNGSFVDTSSLLRWCWLKVFLSGMNAKIFRIPGHRHRARCLRGTPHI